MMRRCLTAGLVASAAGYTLSPGAKSAAGAHVKALEVKMAHVVALDFDGVLCDSEPELTRTAWRTCVALWPEVMERAADTATETPWKAGARRAWTGGQGWEPLAGNGADNMPNWLAAKMRLLRPALETGFESALMMRLCVDEALMSADSQRAQRPLTPGEITANWGPELLDTLLVRYGVRRDECIEAYARTRDAWLEEDLESWLEANAFYEGAIEALRAVVEAESTEVYIVTTKQRRFAQALLSDAGIELDDDRIFGLGSGPKAATLALLQDRHPDATISFVEDKIETLRTVANDLNLFSVGLYFAEWGYSTAEQKALSASMPRVKSLSVDSDLTLALSAPNE